MRVMFAIRESPTARVYDVPAPACTRRAARAGPVQRENCVYVAIRDERVTVVRETVV